MEHGKIVVEIQEDYPGAEWFNVVITLPGYGGGKASRFKLISEERISEICDTVPDCMFRPEYAKAIKKGLESV